MDKKPTYSELEKRVYELEIAEFKGKEVEKASEFRFKEIFDHMSSGVAIYDTPDDGETFVFKDINRSGLINTKKKKDEIVGREVRNVFPGVEALGLFNVFKRVWKTGNPEYHPSSMYKDDEIVLWVENYICKLPSGELVAIYEDTTEQKQAAEAKVNLESQLQHAQKMEAIGTLAGGIAHDFNNILTPFMVHTEMAMMDLPEGHPVQNNLKEALKAGYRARDLVKQILAFSRQQDSELKPISAGIIIKEALKLLRASIPTTIDIEKKMDAEADMVLADPTQIHQIIMNLCTNAAHAMSEQGGLLEVATDNERIDQKDINGLGDLMPGKYLKLTVRDSGHGMDPAIRQRIFEPYYTTKDKQHGTGLGLSVVHGIVQTLNGEITVESAPGQGSLFNVYLPVVAEAKRHQIAPKATVDLPTGNEHILLVDDEKTMVDTVQSILERLGYRVTNRTSSIEALEAFKNKPDAFDLVITDQTMPNMTGKDLSKAILAIRSEIPIILCTGFSEQIDEQRAQALGISAFVMKPVLMNEIALTIRRVLDR